MADWAQIDRELEQLGPAPRDVAALLTRCLGSDRSRAALEAALGALGVAPPFAMSGSAPALRGGALAGGNAPALRGGALAGGSAPALRGGALSTPRPIAPRPRESSDRPLSSHDTMEEWPPEPPPAAQQLADDVDALLGVAGPAAIAAKAEPLAVAADEDEPELSLGGASDATPAPEARTLESTRALLDRELDPSEFPSTPPQRVPTPAPPAAEPTALEDDDFELLIEDEEILEIQEDDVEADDVDET